MSKKEICFKDMKIGQKGECWGDYIANYDRPTWIGFIKDTDYGVTIIEVNEHPQNDGGLCIEANHRVWVEIQ